MNAATIAIAVVSFYLFINFIILTIISRNFRPFYLKEAWKEVTFFGMTPVNQNRIPMKNITGVQKDIE